MKLTIGMIVKNEEKWLDKCLSAIKPILDNVDSELIITDTGSTDKTVEIAKKYTNNVLYFEWIKDFSAARNFGLEKAKGEWFMMLDADDIFRSCDHIIEFFNSGEYKKYNAAAYCSRNLFYTENGVGYSDLWVPRMVKIHPDTRYEGAVHEALTTFTSPFKNLNDVADHYGYLYEDDEAKIRKFKRNSELLLKRYETEKNSSPMLFVQLYECYMAMGDTDIAMKYLDEGIALSEKMHSMVLVSLMFHKISYFYTEKKYETAVEIANQYFDIDKKIRPYELVTDSEIYAIKAESLYKLGRYNEATSEFKNFFESYKKISSGKIATYDAYLVSNFMCTDVNWMPLFNDYINCCIGSNKFNLAESCLTHYPLAKYSFEENRMAELISTEIIVLDHFGYKSVHSYFNQHNDNGKRLFIELLLLRLYISDEKKQLVKVLDEIADDDVKRKVSVYNDYVNGFIKGDSAAEVEEFIVSCANHSLEIGKLQDNILLSVDIAQFLNEFVHIGELMDKDNSSAKAAKAIYEAVRYREEGLFKECISEMKKAVKEYEPIAPIVSEYCSRMFADLENERPVSEMDRLAAMIKSNINAMIKNGDLGNAQKTLNEYKSINPSDPEIQQIEKLLS